MRKIKLLVLTVVFLSVLSTMSYVSSRYFNDKVHAVGSYCAAGCSGGYGAQYLYNGVSCLSGFEPSWSVCTNGSIVKVTVKPDYIANQPTETVHAVCSGVCDGAPGTAFYPEGHTCILSGQSDTYQCKNSGSFVLIATAVPTPTQVVIAPTVTVKPTDPTTTTTPTSVVVNVVFPTIFTQQGSMTTDLQTIPTSELSAYKGLTFDIPDLGSVKFTEAIDLTNAELLSKMAELDKYLEIGNGFISLDSDSIPELKNISATLTMRGLDLTGEIIILKDGVSAGDAVSNIQYDSQTKILTFDVTGFSKYEIQMEKSEHDTVSKNDSDKKEDDNSKTIVLLIVVVTGIISFVVLSVSLVLVSKMKKKNKLKEVPASATINPVNQI
jgi:hypothetical protein